MTGFVTTMELAQIRSACEAFNVPIPAAVPVADALVAAAEALVARVAAEVEPDPYTATVKNLEQLHAALVAWPGHDARVTQASRLLSLAQQRAVDSWTHAIGELLTGFAAPFADAVKRYMAAHTDNTDDPDAVADIGRLALVRRILATIQPARMSMTNLGEATLILDVPDKNTVLRTIPIRVGGDGLPGSQGVAEYSAAWLRIVTAIPGVTLRWNTPADQEALDQRLANSGNNRALGGV